MKNKQQARNKVGSRVWKQVTSWVPVIFTVLVIRASFAESFMVNSGSMLGTVQIGDCMLVNKVVYGIRAPLMGQKLVPVSSPRRGDIIIFRSPADPDMPQPEEDYVRLFPKRFPLLPWFWNKAEHRIRAYSPRTFVKRCVAIGGDTVELRNKQLYVNGRTADEPYVTHHSSGLVRALDENPEHLRQRWEDGALSNELRVRDNFGPVVVPAGHVMAMGDNRDNSWDSRFWGPLDVRDIKGKPLVLYFSFRFPDQEFTDGPESELKRVNPVQFLLHPFNIRVNRIGHLLA